MLDANPRLWGCPKQLLHARCSCASSLVIWGLDYNFNNYNFRKEKKEYLARVVKINVLFLNIKLFVKTHIYIYIHTHIEREMYTHNIDLYNVSVYIS